MLPVSSSGRAVGWNGSCDCVATFEVKGSPDGPLVANIFWISGAEGNGKKDTPEVWYQVTDFYNVLPIEIVRIGVEVPCIGCEEEGNATVHQVV